MYKDTTHDEPYMSLAFLSTIRVWQDVPFDRYCAEVDIFSIIRLLSLPSLAYTRHQHDVKTLFHVRRHCEKLSGLKCTMETRSLLDMATPGLQR